MKPPVAVRAYEIVSEAIKDHKDQAAVRYAISRLKTKAGHAEMRLNAAIKRQAQRAAGITPTKTLVAHCDEVFSLYIRQRDTKDGYGQCCTCGKFFSYDLLDAGHCIRREHWGTRWDERNVHAQCRGCNRFLGGFETLHRAFIGRTVMSLLDFKAANNKRKPHPFEIKETIKHFYNKLSQDDREKIKWDPEKL